MMKRKGSNKYWTRKDVRSGLEERVRNDLDKRGITYGYETEKLTYNKESCKNCGNIISTGRYTPDFVLKCKSGSTIYAEIKGRYTSSDRTKMLRVKRDNPNKDIRLVFQRDQFIRKGSTTRNSDWCLKNGFKYHIGETIPQEWINE